MKIFRTSFTFKVLTVYLSLNLIFPLSGIQTGIYMVHALTGGPSQPEFNSFTPIGTSDMVDLASGDFNYNIPIMDVGGYPLNLSYNSGITMDQEASWVGLGWNLNVGQINRNVRGLPDDFDGDEMVYENNMKDNLTVGIGATINVQLAGVEGPNVAGDSNGDSDNNGVSVSGSAGLTIQYNNYDGISFKPSLGLSVDLSDNVSVGLNLSSTTGEGVDVTPNVSLHSKSDETNKKSLKLNSGIGIGYNTRQGLTNFNMSASASKWTDADKIIKSGSGTSKFGTSGSGSISFVNNTITPAKRFPLNNASFNLNFSGGVDFWSIDGELGVNAYGNLQQNAGDGVYREKAYGYQNTENATKFDVLDFNRENDRALNKNTLVLPTTNYTYDYYSIQGQGLGGMFRPFRSQVQYVYDRYIEDNGDGGSLGIEIEGATGFHVGGTFTWNTTRSHTGVWETPALSNFKKKTNNLNLSYENVYFKSIGEFSVDKEQSILNNDLGGEFPVALKIVGNGNGKYAQNKFRKRIPIPPDADPLNYSFEDMHEDLPTSITNKISRTNRELRNLAIQKITAKEAENDNMININDYAKPHHTAGYKILKNDGAMYVYGETSYNITKEETTFAVDGSGDCTTGLIEYSPDDDNSRGNDQGNDHYFNNIITPSYAHTYLLSSILSSDYQDVNNNGPDDVDLGSYTKFTYNGDSDLTTSQYNWRIPNQPNKASYNAGLYTMKNDQKGSYIYGEKELKYVHKIETKTHVAIFDISSRKDGHGVVNKNGGNNSNNKTYKINTIKLYSKPEYNESPNNAIPIKTAHFIYNYSLSTDIYNNIGNNYELPHELSNNGGKLTLKQVYFTYANSLMGKFTPYDFNYDGYKKADATLIDNNYSYNLKAYDIWGNYKPNLGGCGYDDEPTTAEFPFVEQNLTTQDQHNAYVSAWSLTSIGLPSGGKIELAYEADDYQYIQNKKAMQMFKVVGVSRERYIDDDNVDLQNAVGNRVLYTPGSYGDNHDARRLIVEIDSNIIDKIDFQQKYIGNQIDKPIFFRFLLNMTGENYDFVEGYFKIDQSTPNDIFRVFTKDGKKYASIRIELSKLEGGTSGSKSVNPISKAGWYFGRNQMNRVVYGIDRVVTEDGNADVGDNVEDIARALGGSGILSMLEEIVRGPNGVLRNRETVARVFKPKKSWIRLLSPKGKIGGGVRIKSLKMLDNWDNMTTDENGNPNSDNPNNIYKQFYGQQYTYKLKDGSTSGVATFEPNTCKENPFIEPYYDADERLVAPREVSYVEKPFGISFFPASKVTYSRVEVKNLERKNGDKIVKTNATGKVINKFYTSFDFPTKAEFTGIDKPENWYSLPDRAHLFQNMLQGLLGDKIVTTNELTYSQGFAVKTNDMNAKTKKQEVYNENNDVISSVEYIYSFDEDTNILENKLPVIDELGSISKKEIGTHYDVINDFRESYSKTKTRGASVNLAVFTIGIIPIILPRGVPSRADHTNILHTVTTTKVIHNTGILKEKIATDLGATVSTENLAWDAKTGQVLVTKTKNEYNDAYYSINYPAHWYYKQMGLATKNLDLVGTLTTTGSENFNLNNLQGNFVKDYLINGDELLIDYPDADGNLLTEKFWVSKVTNSNLMLMDHFGKIVNSTDYTLKSQFVLNGDVPFKLVHSGYRNLQAASMASVTLMENPIYNDEAQTNLKTNLINYTNSSKIVNASAIEYTDLWSPQCECLGIPNFVFNNTVRGIDGVGLPDNDTPVAFATVGFNPYLYNVKGNYKAVKSYAFLTGRNTDDPNNASPRKDGFFTSFNPFYVLNGTSWARDTEYYKHWTFASQVSKYSPYGVELENKDALGRYSSAQYGFNYTLPTAVSSNAKYTDMGFDSFEDYNSNPDCTTTHFAYRQALDNELGNAEIINTESHTGHRSIKVNGTTRATLEKRIEDCTTPPGN